MNPFDSTLGTIRCETSQATIDGLLFDCGLRAEATADPHHFHIRDAGRASEPEVARELWQLALSNLREAQRDGALPPFTVARTRLN